LTAKGAENGRRGGKEECSSVTANLTLVM